MQQPMSIFKFMLVEGYTKIIRFVEGLQRPYTHALLKV